MIIFLLFLNIAIPLLIVAGILIGYSIFVGLLCLPFVLLFELMKMIFLYIYNIFYNMYFNSLTENKVQEILKQRQTELKQKQADEHWYYIQHRYIYDRGCEYIYIQLLIPHHV